MPAEATIRSLAYDTPPTSSKTETLPFWCVGFSYDTGLQTRFIGQTVCRLIPRSTVSTDISSPAILFTSPPYLTSSASATTKPSLSQYHWATSAARTSTLSSLSYIPSKVSGRLFINIVTYLCTEILSSTASPTKSGNQFFTCPFAGTLPQSVGWH